jgi:branched-chain amino acid transport system ATP-binding protein
MLDEAEPRNSSQGQEGIFETLQRIHKERDIPILLVEQNAKLALKMSTRALCARKRRSKLEGTGEELLQ